MRTFSSQGKGSHSITVNSYLSGEKEECEQSIVRNEFYIKFGRNFGEYLKQQMEHSKYEFRAVIT